MNDKINKAVASYDGIFNKLSANVPTNGEPDGPIFGNGDIGVTVGGTADKLSFFISKNDMWCAKPHQKGGGMKSLAIFDIISEMANNSSFSAIQHISTGDISIELKDDTHFLKITSYAPYQQAVIVIEVECLGADIELRVNLSALEDKFADVNCIANGNTIVVTKSYTGNDLDWDTKACAVSKAIEWSSCDSTLKAGEKAMLIISVQTNHDTDNHIDVANSEIDIINPIVLQQYRTEHLEWWNSFWQSSGILIPSEPEIEKFWYASNYILACCSKYGKFPPGIFGNWITNDTPNWGGDYHLNYNYQAPLWGAYTSNKLEVVKTYEKPIMDYIPKARLNAKNELGCNGVYSKVGIGPKGLESAIIYNKDGSVNNEAPYWGQKSNSAYAAINMLMRFYTTYDEEYTATTAYPYLLEVIAFWEDYLKFEDGRYVIYNDCIHENGAAAKNAFDWVDDDCIDYRDDFNPILTLGLLRAIFKGALDMSTLLNADANRRGKWLHVLEHLSDFTTQKRNGKTVFRYTERGMDWCDGNSLGIQHIFPSGAIGLSSKPELLQIAKDTLVELNRWEDYNAFPTFFTAAARIGFDPDMIIEKMKAEFKKHSFDNLFIYYGGGGIECCSAVPSCINEMLFQSHESILRFFPVWNKGKDAEFINLRGYGAFIVSASLKNGVIGDIMIKSEKGRPCTILCPWGSGMDIISNGKNVEAEIMQNNGVAIYTFATKYNGVYQLTEK